jgi:hypothetical protein
MGVVDLFLVFLGSLQKNARDTVSSLTLKEEGKGIFLK